MSETKVRISAYAPRLSSALVEEFYEHAFYAALQGCCAVPVQPGITDYRDMVRGCAEIARYATEHRFDIDLVLPRDKGHVTPPAREDEEPADTSSPAPRD